MKKTTIIDTNFAKVYNMSTMAKDAAKYLVKNMDLMDKPSDTYAQLLGRLVPMVSSHTNTLFSNLISADKLSQLYMFSVLRGTASNLPELLTVDDITVDGKYVDVSLPNNLQKAWINLTPILSINKADRIGTIRITDVPKAIDTAVRAFLCMAYNDSKEWLAPAASSLLIEFFTSVVSSSLIRRYNLTWEEQIVPKIMLAWHYAELLSDPADKANVPLLLLKNKNAFRGNISVAMFGDILTRTVDIKAGASMSMDTVIKCIKELGVDRLATIDQRMLMQWSASEGISMMIAMDYPPYLLHKLLQVAGGAKYSTAAAVLKNQFDKKRVGQVLDKLVMDKTLIEGVKR